MNGAEKHVKKRKEIEMAEEIKKTEEVAVPKAEEPKAESSAIEALKAELEALKASSAKQKQAMDSACSDAAEWKRKYRATLDDATREKQEQAERLNAMEQTIASYKEREMRDGYIAKFVQAGYDITTAQRMAATLPSGIPDSFFEDQKAFLSTKEQQIKTNLINTQPNLPIGAPLTSADAKAAEEAEIRRRFGLK